jgi:hypothetical protein
MIHKKHPYLAGILLAFAMIKPQTAGLVVLVMLFEKRFKTISTIGVIDSIGYIIACVILKISPITLMQQFLNANTGGSHAYVGIFSFLYLHGHGIDKMQILIMSMVLGTFLTTMGYVNIRKIHCNENLHNFLIFIPALLCTQFWSYAFDTNKGLLIIPMIVLIYLFLTSKDIKNNLILYFMMFLLVLSPTWTLFSELMVKVPYESLYDEFLISNTFVFIVFIMLFACDMKVLRLNLPEKK